MTIDRFAGEFRFLSNFWPVEVFLDGTSYPSTENAYQAMKSLDPEHRKYCHTCTPGQAKRAGQRAPLRPDWEEVKLGVMLRLLRLKFTPGSALAARLAGTGTRLLEEGNTWGDRFWGKCGGTGENHLGRLLMQVRDENAEYERGNVSGLRVLTRYCPSRGSCPTPQGCADSPGGRCLLLQGEA